MAKFDLRIDSIAAGGDGVGRHDGVVVFVPRTAPGDLAQVEAHQAGRLMRGKVMRLVEMSPQRVEPACAHYTADTCGGCQLQHLTYERQLQAKSGIIRDSLTRIGRLNVADAPAVEPSDQPWRYRRKLTLFVRQRGAARIAGMHPLDKPDAIFEVRDCHITDERVMHVWKQVMAHAELLPSAAELRVSVRVLAKGFAAVVEGGTDWSESDRFLEQVPGIVELWWKPELQSRRRMTANDDAAGASFAQVNAGVAERLLQHVASVAARLPHATAIDAYAGTGDIAVMLAGLGAKVTAIEIDRDAAAVCQSRLPGASVVAASVEHALAKALPTDLVVVNPPRAGLAPVVADALQAASERVKALIYVSCDPGTLARDIKRMNRYRLVSVRGFDMFPQTAHVETVCELVPAA